MKLTIIAAFLLLASCGQQNISSYSPLGGDCSVKTIASSPDAPNGGALITCGNTNSLILNGMTTAYSILEVIDPCGPTPGIYNEVLLRLSTGQILALFADNVNGYNPRLALIPAGNYITTDGSYCHFTVDANNLVSY